MCSHIQLSTRLECTAQVASVIQPYFVLILTVVLKITGQKPYRKSELQSGPRSEYGWGRSSRSTDNGRPVDRRPNFCVDQLYSHRS